MNLDGLSSYKVNAAFREGVTITLDDAPGYEFLVILPGAHNRAYLAAMSAALQEDRNELDSYLLSEELFLRHCLFSINGEDVPDEFHLTHTPAIKELMSKANKMAADIHAEVEEGGKKFPSISDGKIAGVAG